MKIKTRKFFAILLVTMFVLSFLPMTAFAQPDRHASIADFSKTTITADSTDRAKIEVFVRDNANNPLSNEDVYVASDRTADKFYTDSGLNTEAPGSVAGAVYATSDADGLVELWVASGVTGNAKLGVSLNAPGADPGEESLQNYLQGDTDWNTAQLGLIETQNVTFTAATLDDVDLVATGTPATANGVEQITLTATVTAAGNPVANQEVTFTTNKSGLTWDKTSYKTNAAGRAVAKVSSTRATDFDIRAHAAGRTSSAQNIEFDPLGDAFSITKVDGDNQVVANTYESGWLVVNLKDVHDNNIIDTAEIDDITFPTKPTDSNISKTTAVQDHGTNLRFKVTPDKVGDYVIRVLLANGRRVEFDLTSKTQGTITGLTLSYKEAYIAHDQSTSGPRVNWVDADDVSRAATAADLDWSVSRRTLGSVDNDGVFTATDDTRVQGTVTITAVDPVRNLVATADITVGAGPSTVSLEAVDEVTAAGEDAKVNLSLLNDDGEVIGFGSPDGPSGTAQRSLTLNVVSKPAGAIVETSKPGAGGVSEALSETGKLSFDVNSDMEGTVTVVAVVNDDASTFDATLDDSVISGAITLTFGEPVVDRPEVPDYGAKNVTLFIGAAGYSVDGKGSTTDLAPYIDPETGRTMVGVRMIAEALGAEADWEPKDAATEVVYLTRPDRTITINIGELVIEVEKDDEVTTVTTDQAAAIKDGRTVLPFRAVAEAFGADVDYGTDAAGNVEWVSFEQ